MPAYAIPPNIASYLVDYRYATQADIDEKGTDVLNDVDAGMKPFFIALMYQAAEHGQMAANLDAVDASNDQVTMNNAAARNWATRGQIATSVWPSDPDAQVKLAALLNADADPPPPLPAAVPALQDSSVADSTTLSQQKATDIENALAAAVAAAVPPPPANDPDVVNLLNKFQSGIATARATLVSSGLDGPGLPYLDDAFNSFMTTQATLASSGLLSASNPDLNNAVAKFYSDVVAAGRMPLGDANISSELQTFLAPYVTVRDSLPNLAAKEAANGPPPLTTPWPTSVDLQQALTAWLSRQGVPATVWTPGQALTVNMQGPMQDYFSGQKAQLGAVNDAWTSQIQLQLPQLQQAQSAYASATTACTSLLALLQQLHAGMIANIP